MSGIELLGVAASILQLADIASTLISLTNELKDKSNSARGTIQSIQTECSTIQSAVLSIKVWEEATRKERSPEVVLQVQQLKLAVDLLHAALAALSADLEAIKNSLRARLRFVLSDQKLKMLLEEVRWQSNALHLLLSALHLPGPQQNKLKTVANSVSIRYGIDQEDNRRRVPKPGSILSDDREFDFDDEIVNSRVYRDALAAAQQPRRAPAMAPVKRPEYSIFLIPTEFCVGGPAYTLSDAASGSPLESPSASSSSATATTDEDCLTQAIIDDMFLCGYKGLSQRIRSTVPGASSLSSRVAHSIPIRPNESWESRWRLYIYCAPCRWHVDLSLSVCAHCIGFNGFIRVDERLCGGCCDTQPGAEPQADGAEAEADGESQKEKEKEMEEKKARRMESIQKTLMDVEDEWRNHKNHSRSNFTSLFDVNWLQRQNILRDIRAARADSDDGESDEDDDDTASDGPLRLDDYIAHAEDDQRVAAILVFSCAKDIGALLDTDKVVKTSMKKMHVKAVQEKLIYRLDYDVGKDGWVLDVFGRL
ncbi:hypothetical protein R3P38DRAFT_794595 [Favolaschia claudopus]|uniref:Fungal N-terminal domain-containing protein n=1 Tax=Favolaschia claudopus TaxID=2862362 RepID=A0AAW0C346_9AGAR